MLDLCCTEQHLSPTPNHCTVALDLRTCRRCTLLSKNQARHMFTNQVNVLSSHRVLLRDVFVSYYIFMDGNYFTEVFAIFILTQIYLYHMHRVLTNNIYKMNEFLLIFFIFHLQNYKI